MAENNKPVTEAIDNVDEAASENVPAASAPNEANDSLAENLVPTM